MVSPSAETTFWNPPKKLYVFPTNVGMKWVSMTDPWMEEREVPARTYSTLRIDLRPALKDVFPYQWISHQGVIKDSTYYDASQVTNQFGGIVGYWFGYDKFELLDQLTEVGDEISDLNPPTDLSLSQNYPNHFNLVTIIQYTIGGRQTKAVYGSRFTALSAPP